jgi:hypothetical protein
MSTGKITVRSNVVLEPGRWDLVPGELLHALRRMDNATRLQHDEHMYYEPCSVCRRTIAEINLKGCTRCIDAPSPASVERSLDAHRLQIDQARRRELEENAALRRNGGGGSSAASAEPS